MRSASEGRTIPRRPDPSRAGEPPAAGEAQPAGAVAEADAECVQACLQGKRERFAELVGRYQQAVYGVVLAYTRDPHRAEDVAQEVFVNAFTALKQLREPNRFFPWLLQIARHRASREARKEATRAEQPLPENWALAAAEEAQGPQRAADVLAMVEELPEPYRETVLLKYRLGLSCREIAQREGVPVGTITSRLTRALAVLRSAAGGRRDKP